MFKSCATLTLLFIPLGALAQNRNPFAPPQATLHYAPDRTCDLLNVSVDIDVDYPNRTFTGTSVNTLKALRNGVRDLVLHAGQGLELTSVSLDGQKVNVERKGIEIHIPTSPLKKGQTYEVTISYVSKNAKGTGFGSGGGGFHWINANQNNPAHVGFWTQGESGYNSEWAPTWDYPNDLATSETRTTVQADWDVVGNGVLVSTKLSPDKKRKTFTWRMTQPHATYLLSLCGGPFDIKKDTWQGVDLWYVVPKGEGYMIDDSFGHTKDMLTFFSDTLGVKYAWPKYAQNAMFDFGGGMENVSSTTLGEGSLTEARDGFYTMDSLNSHELGHQWFGDLVTCKDWGDTWLNESFATYMEMIYLQHSRGDGAYQQEVDNNMQSYFFEARQYKRPISTKLYSNPDAVFDSHAYPKGGVVLHTLRRFLGDENFYAGLNLYLTQWRHTPVESAQLRRCMTEATGINCEPFWSQWIEKPGHPVIDTTWTWTGGKLNVNVKQTQDTTDGTPIYDIPAKVGVIKDGKVTKLPIRMSKADETFSFDLASKPDAVVFDCDHDFLRQIPALHWAQEELPAILQYAPNANDRAEAMRRIMVKPTDADVELVKKVVAADNTMSPTFPQISPLVNLAKPEMRDFWMAQLKHPDFGRRAQAVNALGKLPADTKTTQALRELVNDKSPIQVVVNAINALKNWDAKSNKDVFEKAAQIPDRRSRIKRAAEAALKP